MYLYGMRPTFNSVNVCMINDNNRVVKLILSNSCQKMALKALLSSKMLSAPSLGQKQPIWSPY